MKKQTAMHTGCMAEIPDHKETNGDNEMSTTTSQAVAAKEGTAKKEKLTAKLGISYALGEVGCQLSWYMVNTYLTLFYTDVVGLSAVGISAIMLIARVWDAINDPMMGNIADHTKSRWGKFRPYLYFAPPFLALFSILTFTVFPLTGAAQFIVCLLCYVGTGMAYTAVCIPYQAMQNVIAVDSRVRMDLATARGIGGSIVGIILSASVMPIILHFSGSDVANAHGYQMTTIILSIIMIPIFWLCATGCKEKYTDQLHTNKEPLSFGKALKGLFKNDQLLMVVLATIIGTITIAGRMGLLTYYIIYVVGDYTHIATVFTTSTIAQLIGTLTLPIVLRKMTKKGYLIFANVITACAFLVLFFNPHCSIPFLLVCTAISGFCGASANVCPGMVSDTIEYGDWKFGIRQEGVAASCLSFGVKLSTAISGSAGVLLLAATGYVAGAEQTAAAQSGINAIVNLLPAVLCIVACIPMFFYKLNPKKVSEIRDDLDHGRHASDHNN